MQQGKRGPLQDNDEEAELQAEVERIQSSISEQEAAFSRLTSALSEARWRKQALETRLRSVGAALGALLARKRRRQALGTVEDQDWALLEACAEGTWEEVHALLEAGANVNYATLEDGLTPLIQACQREKGDPHTESIVNELLVCKANIDVPELKWGAVALHFAALSSKAAVASLLFHGANVGVRKHESQLTALHVACNSSDAESVQIAQLLINHKADFEDLDHVPPLFIACQKSGPEMVQLLLSCGASVNRRDSFGQTALMCAAMNLLHGAEIIPLLVRAGVDLEAQDVDELTALDIAFQEGGALLHAVGAHYTPKGQLAGSIPDDECRDPLGSLQEAHLFGCRGAASEFSLCLESGWTAERTWAALRNGALLPIDSGGSGQDIFECMSAQGVSPELWRLVGSELTTYRHPISGDTLLHICCRSTNVMALRQLKRRWTNPLIRNDAGLLPLEVCSDPAMKKEVLDYMIWKPFPQVTSWYGPYFESRAITFAWICRLWALSRVRIVTKDIQHHIIRLIASEEVVFVNKFPVHFIAENAISPPPQFEELAFAGARPGREDSDGDEEDLDVIRGRNWVEVDHRQEQHGGGGGGGRAGFLFFGGGGGGGGGWGGGVPFPTFPVAPPVIENDDPPVRQAEVLRPQRPAQQCIFYRNGQCRAGARCQFLHEDQDAAPVLAPPPAIIPAPAAPPMNIPALEQALQLTWEEVQFANALLADEEINDGDDNHNVDDADDDGGDGDEDVEADDDNMDLDL